MFPISMLHCAAVSMLLLPVTERALMLCVVCSAQLQFHTSLQADINTKIF